VTWKADGTRYMLLLTPWGVYMVDRAFRITRVQMRFPTNPPKEKQQAWVAAAAAQMPSARQGVACGCP
jgi:hypothetical protein